MEISKGTKTAELWCLQKGFRTGQRACHPNCYDDLLYEKSREAVQHRMYCWNGSTVH